MKKVILITGSTDGIGFATAKMLIAQGHHLLIHGRNPAKLEETIKKLSELAEEEHIESYVADLSRMRDVEALAKAVAEKHAMLDVIINNAGVYKSPDLITQDSLDVRFAVNTIAPYLLMQRLRPLLGADSRVVNVSSAAQAPVNSGALAGRAKLSDDFAAYAQSKLALTMWSCHMGLSRKDNDPAIIAVNPGSMLGSKMVKDAFGVAGGDIDIGAEILTRSALSDEFITASGLYFDNDSGQFASPHLDALDSQKSQEIIRVIEAVLAEII